MPEPETRPVRVAAVNDYELIIEGVAALLEQFGDRVAICERIVIGDEVTDEIDVALYDTYGRVGLTTRALESLVSEPKVRRVAVFSMDLRPAIVAEARAAGADAFISKALPGDAIADALVRELASGEAVEALSSSTRVPASPLDWPGKDAGLTERESQVLVLCAEGMTNAEIGQALFIGAETVKSHMRNVFRRLNLRNRTQAASYVERSGVFVRYQPVDLAEDPIVDEPVEGLER